MSVKGLLRAALSAVVASVTVVGASGGAGAETTLTLWSHWADQDSKKDFIAEAVRRFEAKHPGTRVEVTWYQKNPLYTALKTALRAGQGPDIFYAEPDQLEYVQNKLIADLSDKIDWRNVEDWGRRSWSVDGRTYGLPLEAWTVELYYDRARMEKLGIQVPPDGRFTQAGFLDMVKKAKAAGMTPVVAGAGDRPFTGALFTHELLLKKLGADEYDRLLQGQVKWSDPRVTQVLEYVRTLVDAGAFPQSFSSLKIGESHFYFHTNPGGLTFPMGSFYPSRAFNAPDKGGQPADFKLGIMQFPIPDGAACPECKTIAVGGSYVVNRAGKNAGLASSFLNEMATPDMGNRWLETSLVQTGIKSDPAKISGEAAGYFKMLADANAGAVYSFGLPIQRLQGAQREAFTQVINQALPAGVVSVSDAVRQLDSAR